MGNDLNKQAITEALTKIMMMRNDNPRFLEMIIPEENRKILAEKGYHTREDVIELIESRLGYPLPGK